MYIILNITSSKNCIGRILLQPIIVYINYLWTVDHLLNKSVENTSLIMCVIAREK